MDQIIVPKHQEIQYLAITFQEYLEAPVLAPARKSPGHVTPCDWQPL